MDHISKNLSLTPDQQSSLPAKAVELDSEVSTALNAMLAYLELPVEMKAAPGLTRSMFADAIASAGAPPSYALRVLRRYRVGSLGDGKWCPKPGEVHRAIVEACAADAMTGRRTRMAEQQMAERRGREERRAAITPESMARSQRAYEECKRALANASAN